METTREAAPRATQIAVWFHLSQNLGEMLACILRHDGTLSVGVARNGKARTISRTFSEVTVNKSECKSQDFAAHPHFA